MTAKEARAQQWKNLQDKPFSAKLKYIFTYYWAAILACVCVILFLVSWIGSALLQKDLALSGYLVNGTTRQDYSDSLAQEFMEYQQIDAAKCEIYLSADKYYTFNDSSTSSLYTLEAMVAQIAAKQLDFIITDMETYPSFSAYYADLRQICTAEQLEEYRQYLVYVEQAELDALTSGEADTISLPQYYTDATELEDPLPVGIRIPENSHLFDAYMFNEGDVVFGITHTAVNISNALAFLEFIMS